MIPEFSLSTLVEAKDAKQDKLTLQVRHLILHGTDDDMDDIRTHLAAPPRSMRQDETGSTWGVIFKRPPLFLRMPMKIRSSGRGAGTSFPLPLFGGEYAFIKVPDTLQWLALLNLSVNPTRFLRNQDPVTFLPSRASSGASFFGRNVVESGGETSLDNSDNWIPNTGEFERLWDCRLWQRILRTYLHGVLETIEADVLRATSMPNAAVASPVKFVDRSRFNLTEAETYFEFAVRGLTPISLVASLEEPLRSYNELPLTSRDYSVQSPPPWHGTGLSRVLTVTIRTGVTLKIYAKTNCRVRFEVTHDLSCARFGISEDGRARTKHTFARIEGVVGFLEDMRKDAAAVVNNVLTHIRNRCALPATDKTAVDLVTDFAMALNARETTRILLDALLDKGSITSLPQYRSAFAKLRKAGILRAQNRNSRREHVVTAQYQYPLLILRKHATFALTIRYRTRGTPRQT